jgi:hypothetical protein
MALALVSAVTSMSVAGCTLPPALPGMVLERGESEIPTKHPSLIAEQKRNCRICHKQSDAKE